MDQSHGSTVVKRTGLLRLALFSVPCALLELVVWAITQSLPITIAISVAIWTALGVGGLAQQQAEASGSVPTSESPKPKA